MVKKTTTWHFSTDRRSSPSSCDDRTVGTGKKHMRCLSTGFHCFSCIFIGKFKYFLFICLLIDMMIPEEDFSILCPQCRLPWTPMQTPRHTIQIILVKRPETEIKSVLFNFHLWNYNYFYNVNDILLIFAISKNPSLWILTFDYLAIFVAVHPTKKVLKCVFLLIFFILKTWFQ